MTRKTFLNYYSFLIIHIHAIIIATLHIEKGLTKRAIHASRNIKLRGKNRTHVSKTEREEKKKVRCKESTRCERAFKNWIAESMQRADTRLSRWNMGARENTSCSCSIEEIKSRVHSPSSDDPRSCPRRRPCSRRSRWRQQPSDAYRKWARGSPPSGPRPQEACSRPDRRNPRRSFAVSVIKRGKRNRRLVGWKSREFQPLTNYRIPEKDVLFVRTNLGRDVRKLSGTRIFGDVWNSIISILI